MKFKTHNTKETKRVNALVLLDTQSTGNFVTQQFLDKGIPYTNLGPISCTIRTLSGTQELSTRQVRLSPTVAGRIITIEATVVKDIGDSPISCPSVNNSLPFVANTVFNHRCEYSEKTPDLLVNSSLYYNWVIGQPISFRQYPGLTLVYTREGAIFVGAVKTNCECEHCAKDAYQVRCDTICTKTDLKTLNANIERIMMHESFSNDTIDWQED